MRRILLSTWLFIGCLFCTKAQTTWEKLFSAKGTDVFRCVREVPAGGYIAAGYSSDISLNDTDAFVVRLTTTGDTSWTFKYNGPMSFKDLFYKVVPTMDGGFVLCGYSNSMSGLSDDALYMKLSASGEMMWVKYWGGSGKERAQDIIELPNGNFAIAGYTTTPPAGYYDAFLLVTDNNGNLLFSKQYGGSAYDDANAIQYLSDGGFILGGQSYNGSNGLDQFLIRVNNSGDTLWTKKIGTTNTDNIESILLTPDGFILAGSTNSLAHGDDGYLVKTDTSGNVLWTKTFGGTLPDDFHTVRKTLDGGLILCGTSSSSGPSLPNIWLVKTTATGDSIWSRTFGGNNHDHGYSVQETADGGYIVSGHTGSYGWNNEEAMVVKTDSNGIVFNGLKYTAATSLVSPVSTVCGGPNTQIKVVIRNFGDVGFQNVPIAMHITGSIDTIINQLYSSSFASGNVDTVTFNATLNTSGIGTYTFYCYTINNNDVIPQRNSFSTSLALESYAPAPHVTNKLRCGPGSVTLSANATTSVYWFDSQSGGTLLYSGFNYQTPYLNSTTTFFVQSGLNCPSARVPLYAGITSTPIDPITTSTQICGPGVLTLTAISQDTITWYDSPTAGNVAGTGNTFTTNVLFATTTYYAQSGSGICLTNRIPSTVTVFDLPVNPTITPAHLCGPGTLTLTANSPDSIVWFDSPVSANAIGTGQVFNTPTLNASTTYYVQTINANCHSNRFPGLAEIFNIPSINLGNDTIISGATTLLLDAGSGFNSYSWSTGETNQNITVSSSDIYCVTVTNADNCSNSDCITVDITTGIQENKNLKNVAVYPNPATDKITISLPETISSAEFEIVDLKGEVLRQMFSSSLLTGIDMNSYPKGIYTLRIKADQLLYIQKIVLGN